MAMQGKVAFRYARAIFDLSNSAAERKTLLADLEKFSALTSGHKELSFALGSVAFSATQRRPLIEELAKKLKLSDVATKTLLVLSDMGRMSVLATVVDRVRHLLLESANVVPLEVRSADNLGTDEKDQIEQRFQKILGKNVEASYEVDPSLLGGLQVVAGGRTYDGSLSGWLHSFEEQLVGGNI